jgi:hypothetical protein
MLQAAARLIKFLMRETMRFHFENHWSVSFLRRENHRSRAKAWQFSPPISGAKHIRRRVNGNYPRPGAPQAYSGGAGSFNRGASEAAPLRL